LRKLNYKIVVTVAVIFCAQAYAQTASDVLKKMNEVYKNAQSFSMNLEMKTFPVNNEKESSYSGKVVRSDIMYYSSLMGRVMVVNKNYSLLVDEGQKVITYSKIAAPAPKELYDNDFNKLADSSLTKRSQISFAGNASDKYVIEIKPLNNTYYDKIEATINKTSFTLEKVVYYYKPIKDVSFSKISVNFNNVKLNDGTPASFFSESNYLSNLSKGKVTGKGSWASYKIINVPKSKLKIK